MSKFKARYHVRYANFLNMVFDDRILNEVQLTTKGGDCAMM